MHYKNGRKAEIGDRAIGLTYNKIGAQVGIVSAISPNQKTCNCTLTLPSKTLWGTFEVDYTQMDWLLHVDDVWSFVIGVAYAPDDQDYFAKIQNFAMKWNSPIEERPSAKQKIAS